MSCVLKGPSTLPALHQEVTMVLKIEVRYVNM